MKIKQIDSYKRVRKEWSRNPKEQVKQSDKSYKRSKEKKNLRDYMGDINE